MVDLDQQIKNIHEKLQLLLKEKALLQKENKKLKKELGKATLINDDQERSLQGIRQQVDVLKLGTDNLDPAEKNALSRRIDGYLREIDKCLSLLNT